MSLKLGSVNRLQLGGQPVGVHDDQGADDDHGQLQPEVGQRQCRQSARATAAGDVEDVEHADRGDHRGGDADLPAGLAEAGGDRLKVVGNRERRQGDHDQVVDQDRPAGDEGDQLVEGVTGEGRGAAALAEHRPALNVAERGQAKEQARGEEDQRRQAEAAVGDDAEREVDREADRGVGRGEQPGHAEAALEERVRLPSGRRLPRPRRLPVRPAHCSIRLASHIRPTPTATNASPIRNPTEPGPPPLTSVTTSTVTPTATKVSEKARTAPR